MPVLVKVRWTWDVRCKGLCVCVVIQSEQIPTRAGGGAATSLKPPHSIVTLADLRWIPPETWAPENMTLIEDFRGSAFDSDRFEGWMGVAAGLCVLAL